MTMRERMQNGKLFTDHCEGLPEERLLGKKRMTALNNSDPEDMQTRMQLTKELFGEGARVWVEPPFYCVYGRHIHVDGFAYINVNCSFIDDGDIFIGNGTMFGPGVAIATVGHPIKPDMRKYMYTDPVTIGKNCWIGANVTICPGVTIGDHTVIGAGSVVTKDIPADVVAVGNPCRVLRPIDERDEEYYYKNRPFSDSGIEEDEK